MKVFFASLGCDKNLVDSEVMISMLSHEGYEITDDEQAADVAVVNTCSFILDAKQESVDTILELSDLKETGSLKVLIVCGCLAQRYADELLEYSIAYPSRVVDTQCRRFVGAHVEPAK